MKDLVDDGFLPRWQDPGDVVTEPDVADSTKNTWDVYLNVDGVFSLVETVEDLLAALGYDRLDKADQKAAIRHLRELPSWQAAPQRLKAETSTWLSPADRRKDKTAT